MRTAGIISSGHIEIMTLRKLILIVAFLFFFNPVSARPQKPIRLSPIIQIWNLDEQKLELLFNIVNKTDQPADFSYIVHFNSRMGNGWKEQSTLTIGGKRSQLIRISYKPDHIRIGDFISTAVVLYGRNYKTFYDLAEQYFEITDALKSLKTKKLFVKFSEVFPKNQLVRVPIPTMTKIADELAGKDQATKISSGKIRRSPTPGILETARTNLQLLSFLPAQKSVDIVPETTISTTFSESLDKDSVTHDTFLLITASGNTKNRKVPGQLSVNGSTIVFKPVKALQPDTRYQVVLSNHIRSISGNRPEKTRTWVFSTQKKVSEANLFGPAKEYLKVLMVSPRVRGINILTDTIVQLRLSGTIVPETVNDKTYYLSWKGGKVAAELSTDKDQISLKPLQALKPETIYSVVATPEIRDTTGKGLKQHIKWQFKTRDVIIYPEADDPNILIFSLTHELVSWVKERKGILKIGITAFSDLVHADVNGKRIAIKKDTQVEFEIPYQLRTRTTSFEVTAFTKTGKSRKTFVVHFGVKPKPRKPPFQLITILSATNTDNLNNSPDDISEKISTSKAALTIVPQYEFRIRKPSVLRFKGILLREKYADEDYVDKETSYSQFAIEWEERKTIMGTVIAGVGWNFIRMNNEDFIGEIEYSEETFFSTDFKNRISKTENWQVGITYKNIDTIEDAASLDDETDATEISLNLSARYTLSSLKNKVKIGLAVNDAIGKYQDYSTASAAYRISIPLGNLTPSLGYTHKYKQMAIYNPSDDAKPEYNSGTLSAKLKYKLFSRTSLTAEYKSKSQVSNLDDSTYTTNSGTLSIIQIF